MKELPIKAEFLLNFCHVIQGKQLKQCWSQAYSKMAKQLSKVALDS